MIGGGTTSFQGMSMKPYFLRQNIMLLIFLLASGGLGFTFMFLFATLGWYDGWGYFLAMIVVFYNFGKNIKEFIALINKERDWTESEKRVLRFMTTEIEEEQCRAGKR